MPLSFTYRSNGNACKYARSHTCDEANTSIPQSRANFTAAQSLSPYSSSVTVSSGFIALIALFTDGSLSQLLTISTVSPKS